MLVIISNWRKKKGVFNIKKLPNEDEKQQTKSIGSRQAYEWT